MRKTFIIFSVVGIFIALTAALFGIIGPSKAFPHPGWFDGGIRLFRDDQEIKYYFTHSAWINRGGVPYSTTYQQEYPPLGVVFFSLPRLFTDDFRRFELLFALMTAACYALLAGVSGMLLRGAGRSPWYGLLLVMPSMVYFSLWRFDVFPALLVALALLAIQCKRFSSGGVLLLLAALAKWYGGLFFIPYCMLMATKTDDALQRRQARTVLFASLGVIAFVGVVELLHWDVFISPLLYHLSRPFEVGALGTLAYLGMQKAGFAGRVPLAVLSAGFLALQFGLTAVLVVFGRIKDRPALVRSFIFILIPFMFFGHFFSSQWIVWLVPLYMLVCDAVETALLVALGLLVFAIFPVLFGVSPYTGYAMLATTGRSLLLAALWWLNMQHMHASGALVFHLDVAKKRLRQWS